MLSTIITQTENKSSIFKKSTNILELTARVAHAVTGV